MSDYIEREDAIVAYANHEVDVRQGKFDGYLQYMRNVLRSVESVDAVPVVRCKECRYYQDNNGGYPNADCKWCKDETPDANDYCSCGERK